MKEKDFRDLQRLVYEFYGQENFKEALEVALLAEEKYPEESWRTSHWKACFYSRLGELDKAIEVLERATAKGYWWADDLIGGNEELEALGGRADFKAIVAKNESLKRSAQDKAKPLLSVLTPPDYSQAHPVPLVIALHGRRMNVPDFAARWRPALKDGILLAVPQSSQPWGSEAFCWDDSKLAEDEIRAHYGKIASSYAMDPNQTIITGYSQGGQLAILMALKAPFHCKGFIAVAPSIERMEETASLLQEPRQHRVKGYLFTGTEDGYYEAAKNLHAKMLQNGLECELNTKPGLHHEFPEDFEDKISPALRFVLS